MKDIIITAGGKNVAPAELENELKFSPYISDAIVIGDKRKYLTCLVMIDQENVEKFATDAKVSFQTSPAFVPRRKLSSSSKAKLRRSTLICQGRAAQKSALD